MTAASTTVAELAAWENRDLGVTDWLRIEQPRIDRFADATNDHQWIHVDVAGAASGPFGATIAHGYLTLSLVPHLLGQLLVIRDVAQGINYGLDRVRFLNPVTVGEEIRLAAEVAGVRNRDVGAVQYAVALRVEIRGRERPAMVGQAIYVVYGAESR